MTGRRRAILIAGPTASGKSGAALALAEARNGVVVNADSMQVYDGLRIVTARPSAEDEVCAPHRLYGHVDPAQTYSSGMWLRAVEPVLAAAWSEERLPIVVGGTGLYFSAILGGLDEMPAVPDEVRARWREALTAEGAASLHARLAASDPDSAARIQPTDGQRIVRALEIGEAAGVPLSRLQRRRGPSLLDGASVERFVIAPPREALREAIGRRFDAMIEEGALGEVEAFLRRPGATTGTAGKAIGVSELAAALRGETSLAAASQAAKTRSRAYAKRQETWFRNQFDAQWRRVDDSSALISVAQF
ncbi:tRNA (adenosine(37)-N6)-dimethylallyltransferase MiaA [Antarcticirhabdus aurantiaca]|uniref:tRNA (Adenosine(37)-N6)-dimethylallyltransferase MiaA n=1 Tax=Antarcticirhabdus aurantiaca TaxID=2606717 RepID=A0ACD4NI11_9HYPH|nr:tRNA (adenosine(37)-N6)-dimethylallyltransferase MiaA [Antarcticirhabdus aurantiaca]WAJ26488.1 tRNA (adenosine(37)-N6)-dimethylallyltransferase MiaA [Jeongeuplla avenae]